MHLSRMRRALVLGTASFVGVTVAMSVSTDPAQAAGENWTVYSTHFSPNGHDIPLRYGRHDNASGHTTGFGKYHIDDRGHRINVSWSTFKKDIDETLDSPTAKCTKSNNTWTCSSNKISGVNSQWGNMKVSYTHSDSGTPDGRARGIITAFYLNDCGCLSAREEASE
ncbi:hypothetical protein [Streptomyces zingiberis]|uniref:Uncharacterized protein n=1 Tax=Streptomyces zingiberis TaxID=2053010 RepID=A0ABX1C719_9ACTN|nr:hypothetical protein [Streptomyces zingiberis]NJQ03985.1 hypothetical protein [Streptomyces zingiberis]